jgi:hypothetical protein
MTWRSVFAVLVIVALWTGAIFQIVDDPRTVWALLGGILGASLAGLHRERNGSRP